VHYLGIAKYVDIGREALVGSTPRDGAALGTIILPVHETLEFLDERSGILRLAEVNENGPYIEVRFQIHWHVQKIVETPESTSVNEVDDSVPRVLTRNVAHHHCCPLILRQLHRFHRAIAAVIRALCLVPYRRLEAALCFVVLPRSRVWYGADDTYVITRHVYLSPHPRLVLQLRIILSSPRYRSLSRALVGRRWQGLEELSSPIEDEDEPLLTRRRR